MFTSVLVQLKHVIPPWFFFQACSSISQLVKKIVLITIGFNHRCYVISFCALESWHEQMALNFDSHQVALILDRQRDHPMVRAGFNEPHSQQSPAALRNADKKTRNLFQKQDDNKTADTLD